MDKNKKELAFALFDEGKRPSDLAVKSLGLAARTTYDYFQKWKKGDGSTSEAKGTTAGKDLESPGPKAGTSGPRIEVGKIIIATENWTLDQQGAILILDTYNQTKEAIGYEGTVAQFLVDVCKFYRRVLNFKEVGNGGEGEGSGGRSAEEDGGNGLGKQVLEHAG